MDIDPDTQRKLSRRGALSAVGGLGVGAFVAACGGGSATTDADAASSCVLSPEVTEGPYYVDGALTRRDVTEGRPGVPLELRLAVQNAATCKPIAGANVEIWHADAGGGYSGVDGDTADWLRGNQRAGASGAVRFATIYPGWYPGRTPHIHLKVHVGGDVVHTGQVFFPDAVSAVVYMRSAYRAHGPADMRNASDNIYAQAGGSRARLRMSRRGNGYLGRATLGVAA
jgi:protocatechuate 3,4-dioxygenase beta subunit